MWNDPCVQGFSTRYQIICSSRCPYIHTYIHTHTICRVLPQVIKLFAATKLYIHTCIHTHTMYAWLFHNSSSHLQLQVSIHTRIHTYTHTHNIHAGLFHSSSSHLQLQVSMCGDLQTDLRDICESMTKDYVSLHQHFQKKLQEQETRCVYMFVCMYLYIVTASILQMTHTHTRMHTDHHAIRGIRRPK